MPETLSTSKCIAVSANVAALLTLVPVALYQSRLISSLPDPPGSWFASEDITSSKAAHPLGMPDSYAGLASYALTLCFLLNARESTKCKKLLGAKLYADAGLACFNFGRQIVSFRKLCSWCSGTAAATAFLVPFAKRYLAEIAS